MCFHQAIVRKINDQLIVKLTEQVINVNAEQKKQ